MNEILEKFTISCLDCLEEELKQYTRDLMAKYLSQEEKPSECHKCNKKLNAQAQDVPRSE